MKKLLIQMGKGALDGIAVGCLMLIVALGAFMAGQILAGATIDPVSAHRHAEGVLYPEFIARSNAWAYAHGPNVDKPEHWQRLDKQDVERYRAMRAAWRAFDSEMKDAGY